MVATTLFYFCEKYLALAVLAGSVAEICSKEIMQVLVKDKTVIERGKVDFR